MIKLILDYQDGSEPREVFIGDSFIEDEQIVLDFINSYLYDYFCGYIDDDDLPEPYRSMAKENDLYRKLASTLQDYDVWDGWDNYNKIFNEDTKIEII